MGTECISVFGLDCDRWLQSTSTFEFVIVPRLCFSPAASRVHLGECAYKSAGFLSFKLLLHSKKPASKTNRATRSDGWHDPYVLIENTELQTVGKVFRSRLGLSRNTSVFTGSSQSPIFVNTLFSSSAL